MALRRLPGRITSWRRASSFPASASSPSCRSSASCCPCPWSILLGMDPWLRFSDRRRTPPTLISSVNPLPSSSSTHGIQPSGCNAVPQTAQSPPVPSRRIPPPPDWARPRGPPVSVGRGRCTARAPHDQSASSLAPSSASAARKWPMQASRTAADDTWPRLPANASTSLCRAPSSISR